MIVAQIKAVRTIVDPLDTSSLYGLVYKVDLSSTKAKRCIVNTDMVDHVFSILPFGLQPHFDIDGWESEGKFLCNL